MPDDFLDDYWEICLENEASEALAAALTDAGEENGKNGYSFGVKQIDLKTNEGAGPLLAEILQHVVGVAGCPVTQADIDAIGGGALKLTVAGVDADADLAALRERASAALGLAEARAPLRAVTRREMQRDTELVSQQIAGLGDAIGARAFMAAGAFGRLFLVDYENLFGPGIEKFGPYCAGEEVLLNDERNRVRASAPFGFRDVAGYLLATKQGSAPDATGRADVLRRLATVIRVAEARDGAPLPLTHPDRVYVRTELGPILAAPGDTPIGRNRGRGLYAALEAIVERAG